MKAVLISIQPRWCELIASGKKTVEVRKTKPKLDTPFKCYIYCTKAKEYFSIGGGVYATSDTLYRLPTGKIKFGDGFELMGDWSGQYDENNFLNGKVIGEFVCDEIYDITPHFDKPDFCNKYICEWKYGALTVCLSFTEINEYLKGKKGYGWHISDLKIYDKPRELWEFKTKCKEYGSDNPNCTECNYYIDGMCYEYDESDCGCSGRKPITRPFQSWGYVESEGGE